ncbi:hypothetical protein BRD07_06305 [Halobacteriales archaeon QS_9_68_42]|nr:MAG: hypothetical protein BRC84_00875 [Halobacteriales archaeon QS_1_68_44]PSQ40921.1 MAG: hypothetical protein BRD07_06305 [Halobacteriales archaeon QS_9_68_42]
MADPTDTRGVSEVVGFILVFSLVLGTITLVYASGISGLDNTRDAERITNAERAFDVLANNFQQMARGEAPNRATEMKLAEAQLSTSTEREVNISADGVDPADANSSSSTIRYNPGTDTSIVYENGAVIRVDNGNAVMLEEPDFLFDNGTVVIRYIELKGGGQSIGGTSTTVLVRAERTSSDVLVNNGSSPEDIVIKMQTHEDRAGVWEEYYEEQIAAANSSWAGNCGNTSVGGSDAVIECDSFNADKLAVSKVQIGVELT